MDRCAVIATYHKSGTAWMSSTFQKIGRELGIPVLNVDSDVVPAAEELTLPSILLSPHSNPNKHPWVLQNPEHRILHLIRDPRDMIISGMHYHRIASETWLFRPRTEFDGMNYQEKINSLETDRLRYIFEMLHTASSSIRSMSRWDYEQPHCFECKYEDLVRDTDMVLFERAARHLGFADADMQTCLDVFWRKSIFGGKKKRKNKGKVHIRSGDPRQWPGVFDREMGAMFVKRFGNVLIKLGYESDNGWVDRLPACVPPSEVAAA
jgi:hypothetical protein